MSDEVTFTAEQQVLVDKLVGEARVKARDQASQAAQGAADAAKKKAEQEALKAKAEWQKLAETHESRVKELEPLVQQVEAYQAIIENLLDDRVKALGDGAASAVKALPESMTALDKLNWLSKNVELFQPAGDGGGTPRRPKQKTATEPGSGTLSSRFPIRL